MKYFVTILILLISFIRASAVPAYTGIVNIKQPNGEVISCYIKGDEVVNWLESEDGYTLLRNSNNYFVYALKSQNNDLIPSDVIYSNNSISSRLKVTNIVPKLRYSDAQIESLKAIWEIKSNSIINESTFNRARSNVIKTVCALVEFPDRPMVKSKKDFEMLLNQIGYNFDGAKGSVKDYFYENSYQSINLTITVMGIYKAPNNASYYGGRSNVHVKELAQWVLNQVNNELDFTQYDNDNNGWIDAFHMIFAGHGMESTYDNTCIWSHKWGFPALTLNGKHIDTYSCSPELRTSYDGINHITTIGTICHEMNHVFGSPDFYDTDYENNGEYIGTGDWDLMGGGSWNGYPSGSCPAHINIYQKIKQGWVTPQNLPSTKFIESMESSAVKPIAFICYTKSTNEYFILENKQRIGFDKDIPGSGLLIYRVSNQIGNRDINTTHPQQMYPICASSNFAIPNLTPSSYGYINSSGCTFPGSNNKVMFTDTSIPSAKSWAGDNTEIPIRFISEKNGLISFYTGNSFSISEMENKENKHCFYIKNVSPKDILWNVSSSDFILQSQPNGTVKVLANDYGKSATLKAQIYHNNQLITEITKQISSPSLALTGCNTISCCGHEVNRPNYLPYNATLTWNTSSNIDINGRKGDSIRVAAAKNSTGEYWIEAVVNANGKRYTKRKTISRVNTLGSIELNWTGVDRKDPEGKKRLAFIVMPYDNKNVDLMSYPKTISIRWNIEAGSGLTSATANRTMLQTEGAVGYSSYINYMNCMKDVTIPGDSMIVAPWQPATFAYPVGPPIGPVDPIEPVMPDAEWFKPRDGRCKAIVTLPDNNYRGKLTCVVIDDCGNKKIAQYAIGNDNEDVYPLSNTPALNAPVYTVSPNPANDVLVLTRNADAEAESALYAGRSASIAKPVKLVLFNDYGIVGTMESDSQQESIRMNTSGLADGTYYLNIVIDGNIAERRTILIRH